MTIYIFDSLEQLLTAPVGNSELTVYVGTSNDRTLAIVKSVYANELISDFNATPHQAIIIDQEFYNSSTKEEINYIIQLQIANLTIQENVLGQMKLETMLEADKLAMAYSGITLAKAIKLIHTAAVAPFYQVPLPRWFKITLITKAWFEFVVRSFNLATRKLQVF